MKEIELRYGCNPHQRPARVYALRGELPFKVIAGQPGYINLLDLLNGWQLARELQEALGMPAATSFKHVSPAGAAVGMPLGADLARSYFVDDPELSPLATAYARARGADRMSAFGDSVAVSAPLDLATARMLEREVANCVIAPGYEPGTVDILRKKMEGKFLAIEIDPRYEPPAVEKREVFGVGLEQLRNDAKITPRLFENVVTKNKNFTAEARRDLIVATIALKYTQSNSVCFAAQGQVIGIGAGQQSRIHCTRLAAEKAERWFLRQHPHVLGLKFKKGTKRPDRINAIEQYIEGRMTPAEESRWRQAFATLPEPLDESEKRKWLSRLMDVSLSSDAFFPFRDNIDRASRCGVKYVLEPGGSLRDREVIAAADEYGMVMAFSGLRLFHH